VTELPVFCEAQRVGTVEGRGEGASFIYDPAWLSAPGAFPISILMPLQPGKIPRDDFQRWAAGLLPQGAPLLALARHLGKAPDDTIGILAHVGGDTSGALSLGQPGSSSPDALSPVSDAAALGQILSDLLQKSFLAGADGPSAILAGAQAKLPVAVDGDGRICIPHAGAPSTHLLKPGREHQFGGVQNEALCLTLARRCGLAAPAVSTGRAGDRSYLLIERYDRYRQAGCWHRLHQESLFQALGDTPGADGPALADALSLARRVMRAPDVLGLIDRFIFDVLICNPAPPASNVSLMLTASGPSLAPVHGLASLAAWHGISRKLERMISGESIDSTHWQALAADCGLNAARLLARVETLADAVLGNVREAAEVVAAMPAGTHPLLARLVVAIEARARRHGLIAGRYRRRKLATSPTVHTATAASYAQPS
jgi:serine/threonine-protein kinase HipA